ncbi:hypothetical protein BAR24_04450 [Gluconobacter oxydans]|uniref:hypothetical protein n=1 Tax=Gluconobacter thailandicus TaxID=257438 RepID=UPI0002998072|nr:hypothetical protein [Gluconobacter thailandicus]AFW00498.1 hypothetical protein B932_0903 [Gluconobacter oxydans H24]ANQ40771.1 hypothetical protein BAR24_04450 [Gluconobacter oxydans]
MARLYDEEGLVLQATDGKALLDTGPVPGSVADFAARLRSLLPAGWFPAPPQGLEEEKAPVLVAILTGFSTVFASIWTLMEKCRRQMRLATMSDAFLDMLAADYFGVDGLPRRASESDDDYRARIVASLVAPRNTRQAVRDALFAVTGVEPVIIEPLNAADCHAHASLASPSCGGGVGYGCAGFRYGSQSGGQFFLETALGQASDRQVIYQVIERTSASGITGWVRVEQ